ncbi:MAG TPA: hydroxymethylbilane synthase [Syntrophorhabdaceae bacterium]|nr:hydroxymethylbilane synthase [Syntrophorhabdaceae bacterium]
MIKKRWVIGTRGSGLALKQSTIVIERLKQVYPQFDFEIKIIKTKGDTIWDKPLHLIGGKGLFVKEIEEALLKKEIDIAVHSAKDLPVELEKGLMLGAVLEREDPRDVFISEVYKSIYELNKNAKIGTSSLRRKAQLLNINRDLEIIELRGNVDTRIRRMQERRVDAIILAYAGVKRMGFQNKIKEVLPVEIMVPPAGQGAIGIEIRQDEEAIELLKPIDHKMTRKEIEIERTLQQKIGGGCHVPLGINASVVEDMLNLHIMLGKENGEIIFKESFTCPINTSAGLIETIIKKMPNKSLLA